MINKLYILLFLLLPVYNYSQVNCDIIFEDSSASSTNNTIAIQSADVEIGDQIGVFYIDDFGQYICSSTITWTGEVDALVGFGDDSFTSEIDGFFNGDEMLFFSSSTDGTIYELSPIFDENLPFSSTWQSNGFTNVLSLSVLDFIECADEEISGCIDSSACNYNDNATEDDGFCIYVDGICEECSGETDGTGIIINNDIDFDGICDSNDPDIDGDGLCDNYQEAQSTIFNEYNCSNGVSSSCSEDINFSLVQFINIYGECFIWMGGDNPFYNGPNPPNGGQMPYSYSWQFNGEEFSFGSQLTTSNVNVGLYTVVVTDSNGCQSTANLNIESTLCVDCGDTFNVECADEEILGCIDSTACNYNENATNDDGSCTYAEFGYNCLGECLYPDPNDSNNCLSDYEPIVITNVISDPDNNQVTVEWTGGLSIPTIEINLLTGVAYNIDSNLDNNGSYTFEIPCSIILDANNDGILDENESLEYAVDINQNFINSPNLAPCYTVTNDYLFWGENLEGIGCNDCDVNTATCSQTNFYTNSNSDLNQLSIINLSVCIVPGCTDSSACNYNVNATNDDGSCIYVDGICETCENGIIIDNDSDNDGICNDDEIVQVNGCTEENAFNFDSSATNNDGSCCFVNGCSQSDNILYNPDACFFDDNLCLSINDCPDVTIIPFTNINNVSCFNESDGSIEVVLGSTFGGTPPYNVFWDQLIDTDGDGIDDSEINVFDPNNDGVLENLIASNYRVSIVDNSGCTGSTIVSVTQPAEINVNYDFSEILCSSDESTISVGIEGTIMNYDVSVNGEFIETVFAGSPTITTEDDFDFTQTGSNNTIVIFGCDDSDCSDINGIINPGDIIGIFYENVNGDLECGGSATFNGTIPFASLSGWQTEFAQDNGFEDGDPYIWYLFDTSGDIYQLIPNYDLSQGLDYFTPGGFTVVSNFEIGTILGSNDDFYYSVSSGEYLIEVVAENGCNSSTTINISEPNELQIDNFNVVNPTCNGSQDGYINIELIGGTGELSYSWTGSFGELFSTDQNIYNLSPGNYTVTITDENNCLISQTYEIIDPQIIDVLYSYDPIICNGDNTVLSLEVSGGVPPYTINYNGEDPDNISSGFYTFSVTDGSGCLETFDVSINNPDGIAISFPTVETVCYGETNIPVDFSMSVSGGNPPYSYEWFDENDLSLGIFSPSSTVSPGNYSIIITDSENCVSVPSYFTISEPEQINVDFDLEDINCFGETATANFTIDGSPGSYTIFFNDVEETTTIGLSDINFDWTNTGVNASIVISEITGLDLNNGDLIGVFYTSSNGVQCGGTTIYDEDLGFPISLAAWGEETGQDNGFVNGEEFLFLINSGGLVYEVDVSFNLSFPGFTDVFEINGLSQIENMNVTGVFSDGPDFSFDNLEQNSYLVEIVDGNGCAWDSTIVVSGANELFVSNEIISAASCFGDLAEISTSVLGGEPPYTYEWQNLNTGELISIQPEPQLPSGTFLFTVNDSNGCSEINVFEVPQESGQVNITTQDEQCSNENDGYIEACVNWENTITYSLTNLNGTTQEFTTVGDGIETCYIFNNLSPDIYNLEVLSFDGCIVSEQINIIQADPILVAFDTSPANCFDNPSGTIIIQEIFGGNPPFEIDWNGVDTEAVLPGFHSFVITDENGCSKTYNYSISSPTEINTSAVINQNNCYNSSSGSIILSVDGGVPNYNYLWTNSDGIVISFDSNIFNLPSDTYTVEITDSSGCVYVEDYTILDENDDFIFTVNSTPADCFAGFGTSSANVLNEDNLLYDFNWPNGIINNGEEIFLPAGDYELIVVNTITGCEKSQLFSVFEPEEFIIQVDFDPILCFEDLNNDGVNDITTSVNSMVLGGADFDIDGDGINNNIDNDIDNDGIVNILDDDIDGDGILNEFDDDGLIWIDGDVDKDGIVNDEDTDWNGVEVFVDKNFLNPGIYFVYTFDSNGCYTITEFEITSPEEFLIDASPNQILCFGEYGSSDLNISGGTPPYEIIWLNTLSGDVVDPSALLGGESGISYTVEVTDQNGCFEFDTFVIDPEPEEITLTEYTSNYNDFEVSCFNYSDGWIDLDVSGGTPPYSYSWVGPNGQIYNDQDIYNLSSGLYSINITDSNGCQLNSSFEPYTIYMQEPDDFQILFSWTENAYCEESNDGIISITTNGGVPNFNYTINNSSEINEGGSFLTNLDIDNLNIENENSIVIENLEAGFYSINILSDQNNCISSQILDLEVGFDEENCLFIPTIFTPNSDGLNDTFDIYGIEYYPDASVFIYDRWGVKKFESKNNIYVPWDGLTDGVENEIGTYYYVIELNTGQKKYSGSITLKR